MINLNTRRGPCLRSTAGTVLACIFHFFAYLWHFPAESNLADNRDNSLCTSHGTLVSVDDGVHVPTQRSFAALVGLTWRRHVTDIEGRGSPSMDVQHVKTLRLVHSPGRTKSLKGMVVEWEGIVAAVEEVKEDVLLVAQRPLSDFQGESDTLGKRLGTLALNAKDVRGGSGGSEDEEIANNAGGVPKLRILELRAQAMAEAVAEEWPGRLPEGFY